MEDNFYDGDYYERHHYHNGGHWSLQRVAFHFTNGRGEVIDRCDFTVNPSSMQYNYPDRNVFIQTLGRYPGMQGYGAGLHTIQISGQTGYHKTAIMTEGATGKDTNYGQAKKLKRLLLRSENEAHDDFDNGGTGFYSPGELQFMNYTDGDCYQVELSPQAVQFSRTNNDPLTYYYTISMTVIRKIKDPLPNQMTVVHLGNDHTFFPTSPVIMDKVSDNITTPFNELYHHPLKKYNAAQAFLNGRGSILNPRPEKHINSIEDKPSITGKPQALSVPQKARIMSAIDSQNGITHTVKMGAVNARVGGKNAMPYWLKKFRTENNQTSGIKPVQVQPSAVKNAPVHNHTQPHTPNRAIASFTGQVTPTLPAFSGVTDGNSIHVLVPSQDFVELAPQKTPLQKDPKYYAKRFFKNTADHKQDAPISNLFNGNLTVSKVVSDDFGDLTIEPVAPDMEVPSHQEELTTVTDQNKAFVIQPNQFSSTDVSTPVNAQAVSVSSDYIELYRKDNQLVLVADHKGYTNPDNTFVLSDLDNQMEINSDIDPNADNWLKVTLKGGNLYITPSGPETLYNNNYYLNGQSGSHTVFGNSYMIVPNDNKRDTVFDSTYHDGREADDQYSADTKSGKQARYGMDAHGNVRLVTVNGDVKPFNVSDTPVSARPKLNMSMKYKNTEVNPDIIQGQSSKQNVNVPRGSENND